jgi:hypothetical protein
VRVCLSVCLFNDSSACLKDMPLVQYGRRPQDIAFAAGNKDVFLLLHEAAEKRSPQESPANLPDPADFWKYIEKSAPTPADTTGVPHAEEPLRPPPRTAPGGFPQLPKSRQEFEGWLGGVLFPQRAKRMAAEQQQLESAAGAPYGHMNTPVAPAAQRRPELRPATHSTGSAGGSQFAAHRQSAAAAPTPPMAPPARTSTNSWAPESNVQLGLEPYEPSQATPLADASVALSSQPVESKPQNPLAGFMQAVGQKVQQDIHTTVAAAGKLGENFSNQQKMSVGGAPAPAGQAFSTGRGSYPEVPPPLESSNVGAVSSFCWMCAVQGASRFLALTVTCACTMFSRFHLLQSRDKSAVSRPMTPPPLGSNARGSMSSCRLLTVNESMQGKSKRQLVMMSSTTVTTMTCLRSRRSLPLTRPTPRIGASLSRMRMSGVPPVRRCSPSARRRRAWLTVKAA